MTRFALRLVAALATSAGIAAVTSACDQPSGCDDAKKETELVLKDVCQDPAYQNTPFCACCVKNDFYSVDNECGCRGLNFDADACYFRTAADARPAARQAIEFANSICEERTPTFLDGSGENQQCGASRAASSSSQASSSSAEGAGGAGSSSAQGAGGAGGSSAQGAGGAGGSTTGGGGAGGQGDGGKDGS
ncbi:hypothetical protein [Sorangium sp. So ce124]|uniref:hypothetical protein n=1 Tax=Sorangium sp. So ce124 TaxID=3133280 RepID=UPI003F60EFBA